MKGATDFSRTLGPVQRTIFWELRTGKDRDIAHLFHTIRIDKVSPTLMHRAVGSVTCKLNKKLIPLGYIIKPGTQRYTYRMYPLGFSKR